MLKSAIFIVRSILLIEPLEYMIECVQANNSNDYYNVIPEKLFLVPFLPSVGGPRKSRPASFKKDV